MAGKRGADGAGKKRRTDYQSQIPTGTRGIIVSSLKPQRLRQAQCEVVKLIRAITGESNSSKSHTEDTGTDFDNELSAELKELAAQDKKMFRFYELCRGVGFVTIGDDLMPSELCARVCKHVRDSETVRVYDTARILPIDIVVSPAHFSTFINDEGAMDYLTSLFPDMNGLERDGVKVAVESTWKVELNRRNNTIGSKTLWFDLAHAASLGVVKNDIREACIKDEKDPDCPELAKLIIPLKAKDTCPYKIVMTGQKHTLVFEINPKFIGLGIAAEYEELQKYNLTSLRGTTS